MELVSLFCDAAQPQACSYSKSDSFKLSSFGHYIIIIITSLASHTRSTRFTAAGPRSKMSHRTKFIYLLRCILCAQCHSSGAEVHPHSKWHASPPQHHIHSLLIGSFRLSVCSGLLHLRNVLDEPTHRRLSLDFQAICMQTGWGELNVAKIPDAGFCGSLTSNKCLKFDTST